MRPTSCFAAVTSSWRVHHCTCRKLIGVQVTDAASEAKANVRCLATLETSLAPMACGAPKAALAALPALVAALHAMHTVSRYWMSCLAKHDSFRGVWPCAYRLSSCD